MHAAAVTELVRGTAAAESARKVTLGGIKVLVKMC